ncbi:MAG: leucine-rich repeat protein [Ruminococcus flavefaciens]|nr:leucine-rich repeat protein [Ruminococcus flavefaciens]
MKRMLSAFVSLVLMFTFLCSSFTVYATEPTLETNVQKIENDISVNGTNSFGQLLSDEIVNEVEEQESNNGFNVFSAEVTDNIVTVEYETLELCTMLVVIYDESKELMIASGSTEVTPENDLAEVTIKIDNMPQYFYLRVFLIDSDTFSPLCTVYESPNYTQKMQKLFAKTTDNFDEELIVTQTTTKTTTSTIISATTTTTDLYRNNISLGDNHTAYISEDGSLWMWGNNEYGQLGNGTTDSSAVPIKIMDNVKFVSLGNNHSAAITEEGNLYMWGKNESGQVGNGTHENILSPVKIMSNVKYVALGENYSAAVTNDGNLYVWGYNYLKEAGKIVDSSVPVMFDYSDRDIYAGRLKNNVKYVVVGDTSGTVFTDDNLMFDWADNHVGWNQEPEKFKNVYLDYDRCAGIIHTEETDVLFAAKETWIKTEDGIKIEYTNENLVGILPDVQSASLGYNHSAAITKDGTLFTWGLNNYGQLGNRTLNNSQTPEDIMDNVNVVSLGYAHSAAITNDGSLYMWGNNEYGQLGDGSTENNPVPTKIEIPSTPASLPTQDAYFYADNKTCVINKESYFIFTYHAKNSQNIEDELENLKIEYDEDLFELSEPSILYASDNSSATIMVNVLPRKVGKYDFTISVPDIDSEAKTIFVDVEPELVLPNSTTGNAYNHYANLTVSCEGLEDVVTKDVKFNVTIDENDVEYLESFLKSIEISSIETGDLTDRATYKTSYNIADNGKSAEFIVSVSCDRDYITDYISVKTPAQEKILQVTRSLSNEKTFKYAATKDKNKVDIEEICYYSDDYFADSSYNYNANLSTMSLCLELSAYGSNETDDYTLKSQNARELLVGKNGLGFENFEANDVFKQKEGTDTIGVVAASKDVSYSGQDYKLVAVAVRGGNYGAEWAGNFNLGYGSGYDDPNKGRHTGFYKARDQVIDFVEDYLKEYAYGENIKLWIVGYSRGGATANLTGAYFDDVCQDLIYCNLKTEDIFTYTFEAPRGAVADEALDYTEVNKSWKPKKIYTNIFNIINDNDVVPKVAMPKWYFVRYGVDLHLPSPESLAEVNATKEYETFVERMMIQMNTLKNSLDNYSDNFKMKKIHYTFPYLETEINDGIPQSKGGIEFVDDEKNNKSQAVYFDELVNILTVDIAKNRKNYVDNYQNAICETMKLLNDSDKSDSFAEGWILLLNSATDACFQKIPVLNVVVDLTTDALTSKAKELCNNEYDCTYPEITSVGDAVKPLANIIGMLSVFHPNHAATILKNFDSLHTHEPEICLAWLMSFDNNYNNNYSENEKEVYGRLRNLDNLNNIGYRTIYINCPVNIEVYCNNKLVGEIIDDEPQEIDGSSIITSVENEGKVVYLPFDADYEIKIIATDDGLLDYSINEYSYYTGFTNRVINYYDLELTNGESYIAEIPAVNDNETIIPVDVEYTLTTNNEIITPDSDVNGDEVMNQYSDVNVSVDSEEYGGVYGGGMYLNGTSISLTAVSAENGVFIGWYDDNDKMISSEQEYTFVVKNDLNLTAKFEKNPDTIQTTTSSTTTTTTKTMNTTTTAKSTITLNTSINTTTTVAVSNESCISVENVSCKSGETIDVNINISNNPGIIALSFDINYDRDKLELISVSDGKILGSSTFTIGDIKKVPCKVFWDDNPSKNNCGNGTVAVLTFKILNNTKENADIDILLNKSSTFDINMEEVSFKVEKGVISISDDLSITTANSTTTSTTSTTITTAKTTTTSTTSTKPTTTSTTSTTVTTAKPTTTSTTSTTTTTAKPTTTSTTSTTTTTAKPTTTSTTSTTTTTAKPTTTSTTSTTTTTAKPTTTSTTSTTTTTAKPTTTSTTSTTTTTAKPTTTSTTSTTTTTAKPTTTSTTSTTTTTAKPITTSTTSTTTKPTTTSTTSTTTKTAKPTTTSTTIITEIPVSDLLYEKYNDHVEITGCNKDDITDIRIPAEIEGLPVTEIGSYAFYKFLNLESVVIPSGVTSIGWNSFRECPNLKSVVIPDSVTIIDSCAFFKCSRLENVTIPESVTSIDGDAFYGTQWLYNRRAENPLVIINNILLDGSNCTGDVVIPDGVTCIEHGAFSFCSGLTSIIIPNSVTSIGGHTFESCKNLKSVKIPNSITNISTQTFLRCSNLESIEIPDSVVNIGESAFADCSNLKLIKIPNLVTKIGSLAFENCTSLESIVIPNGVTEIRQGTFENCTSLKSITIFDSVTYIEFDAFENCSNLESITIENPKCKIYNSESTISETATIYGYKNSTAQEYAEKYSRNFVEINDSEIVLGDINGDGMIDAIDATAVLVEYANLSTGGSGTFSESQKSAGDVNSDGMTDAVDATMILTFYAYLSTGGAESDMRVWLDM